MLGDRQRADLVIRDHAARVADYVRVPDREPEDRIRIQTRVHTGNDRDLLGGRQRQIALVKALGKGLVVPQELVDDAHSGPLRTWFLQHVKGDLVSAFAKQDPAPT